MRLAVTGRIHLVARRVCGRCGWSSVRRSVGVGLGLCQQGIEAACAVGACLVWHLPEPCVDGTFCCGVFVAQGPARATYRR
jgi:hypothetical protein